MPSSTPRGVGTSEFWLVVAGLALAAAHLIASALGVHFSTDASTQANVATTLPLVYAALRTYLKTRVPTVGAALPDLFDAPAPSSPSIGATVPQPALDESTTPPVDAPVQVVPTVPPAAA